MKILLYIDFDIVTSLLDTLLLTKGGHFWIFKSMYALCKCVCAPKPLKSL